MRICIISGSFPPLPCGVGDSTKLFADELSSRGHNVTVVTSTSVAPSLASADVSYNVEPVIDCWAVPSLPRIAALVSELAPELILVQYPTSAYQRQLGIFLLPLALRAMSGARLERLIVIVHEFRRTRWLKRVAIAFMVAAADRALVFPEDVDSLRRFLPGPLLRIGTRPPSPPTFADAPVSEQDREALRAEFGCEPGDVILGYFGFISPRKGLDTLIEATARLIATDGLPVRLVIAGGPAPGMEPLVEELKARTVSLGIGNRVTWCGYQEDGRVLRILKTANACVLPFDDGFSPGSASFAQAAACGSAIVTTRPPAGSAIAERVVDGTHVLLFPPRDSAALARAIRRLIDEPELRHRLSAGVRELTANRADAVDVILRCADLPPGVLAGT